ncbi:MAG: hypothetical protein M1821_002822 [Bathelium mastoideum]|nr:MAG: hypothetical protein M1821_002822 [Bathelium mastoideum]KAI9694537.1 MAG: hypothetical protein M1822_000153 [Bathelium mastoideum]
MNSFTSLPTPMSSPNLPQASHFDNSSSANAHSHGDSGMKSDSLANRDSRPDSNPLLRAQSWLLPASDTEADSRAQSPSGLDENTDPSSSNNNTSLSPSNSNTPWSSAVGRATTGKSGRVIERLMAENDRLRRELRAELLAREELQKRLDTARPLNEALQVANGHLEAMRVSDEAVLARRERRIEELRGDLEAERGRREGAERRANEMVRLREEGATTAERKVAEAAERAKNATLQADLLEVSHKQLKGEYRQRTETLARGIQEATVARQEDKGRLQKLDVVLEQMRQELERANRVNEELRELVEGYGKESERKVRELGEDAEERDREGKRLREEMSEVVEKMRWVMGVKSNVKTAS